VTGGGVAWGLSVPVGVVRRGSRKPGIAPATARKVVAATRRRRAPVHPMPPCRAMYTMGSGSRPPSPGKRMCAKKSLWCAMLF
jgi:hypothetical protein